jgi:hypothetical protein
VSELGLPPEDGLWAVLRALSARGAVAAVGGSGLLAALGLATEVHDWDVTTDADTGLVRAALHDAGVTFRADTVRDGVYRTRERFTIDDGPVDLLVRFAIGTPDGVVELPTRVSREWRGLPIADPAVWARAYRLLGRNAKADLLEGWLRAGK